MLKGLVPHLARVDGLTESFIERKCYLFYVPMQHADRTPGLRKAVAIPSVSAQDENRQDVFRVCDVLLLLTNRINP